MKIKLTDKIKEIIRPELNQLYDEADNFATLFQGRSQINYDYYNGDLPKVLFDTGNNFKDRTCQTVVNGAMQDLITCFTSGSPVRFAAVDDSDFDASRLATDLVNQIVLRDNKGYQALESALKEACITGVGWIKRYWAEEKTRQTVHKENIQSELEFQEYLMGLKTAGISIDDADIEATDNGDGTMSAKIAYEFTRKYVRLEHTPIEEIRFEQQAKNLDECVYFCHVTPKTKADILALGYPEDQIDQLQDYLLDTSEGVNLAYTRSQQRQDLIMDNGADVDSYGARVKVKEHYYRTDKIENDGTLHLYKILEAGCTIFDIEEVDEIPFTVFAPIMTPSNIIGESLVELVSDIQDVKAQLKRLMLDHMAYSVYPRYMVSVSDVDKRSLVAPPVPGQVIELKNNGARLELMPTQPLPAQVDYLFNLAEADSEARTGISKTSQGLNPELAARTGSESVSMVLAAAQGRIRYICRTIANNGMRDLMNAVYEIFRTNSETPFKVFTANGVVEVTGDQLPSRNSLEVAVALSPNERQDRTAKLEQLITGLANIQQLNNEFVTPLQKHYLTQSYIESLGFKDTANYIIPLEQYQPPQPGIMDQLQAQAAQAQIEFVQAQSNKLLTDAHIEAEKLAYMQEKDADEMDYKNRQLQYQQEQGADHTNIEVARINLDREVETTKAIHNAEKNQIHQAELDAKAIKEQSEIILKGRQQKHQEQISQQA